MPTKTILAVFSDNDKMYVEDTPYEVAVNGLFMGTYDQWIAKGGKPSSPEVEKIYKMAGF